MSRRAPTDSQAFVRESLNVDTPAHRLQQRPQSFDSHASSPSCPSLSSCEQKSYAPFTSLILPPSKAKSCLLYVPSFFA